MKKSVILLFVIMGMFSCKSTQSNNNNPLQIETATYQNWYGGREGSRGIKIEIKGKKLKDCTFKTIYFSNKQAPIDTKITNENEIYLTANINTAYRKHDRILSSDRNKELKNKVPVKPKYPNLGKEEAVLEYVYKEKLQTIKVTLLKKKDLLYQ